MVSSSSSSSLMLMKFERFFLEERLRPSKHARAVKRFTRFVSDEVDPDAIVRKEGPLDKVGESGSGESVMRNDWPAG